MGIVRNFLGKSPMFDGKVPHWYHTKCFFLRARPQAVGDISHFDSLRWEDQEELRKMLENCLKGGVPASVKGKKGSKNKNGDAPANGLSAHGTLMKFSFGTRQIRSREMQGLRGK